MRLKPSREHIRLFIAADTPRKHERAHTIDELEWEFKVETYEALLQRHNLNTFPRWQDTAELFFCRTCATPLGESSFMGLHVSKCPKCQVSAYDFNEAYLLSKYICGYPDEVFTHLFGTFLGAIHYGRLDYEALRAEVKNAESVLDDLRKAAGV